MKCPGCGQEVNAERSRFCIYCGESLSAKKQAPRAVSGVMRLSKKADFSQSALPEVQQESAPKMNLASLSGSNASAMKARKEDMDMPAKQSRALEDLLSRLDGSAEEPVKEEIKEEKYNLDDEFSELDDALRDDGPLSGNHRKVTRGSIVKNKSLVKSASEDLLSDEADEEIEAEEEFELDMSSEESYASLSMSNEFFQQDEVEDADDSDQMIPNGSGTYARTPSGGFRLTIESLKASCANLIEKVQEKFSGLRGEKTTSRRAQSRVMASTASAEIAAREKKQKTLAIAVVSIAIVMLVVLVVASSTKNKAVDSVPTNDTNNFELVALDDVDTNDSANELIALDDIPTFVADDTVDAGLDFAFADEEADPEAAVIAPAAQPVKAVVEEKIEAKPVVAEAPAKATLTEKRKYGRNDNLLASGGKGETVKLNRSCVMREGPASRFPFVSQLNAGQKVEILSTTDEDWVFENGVWSKAGQAKRLGPGAQFAIAESGMTVAAPTSRVISAKNWRYVKAGKTYGYVGPACFK